MIHDFTSLNTYSKPISILDAKIPLRSYLQINMSASNIELQGVDISNPRICQEYINKTLKKNDGIVAYGGYLEKRNLYASSSRFSKDKIRDIHIGMDFWCKAGTRVIVPISGKVHSFKNNADIGNYGPTIILEHKLETILFYTLYGHLSLTSLEDLYIGKEFSKGDTLATLGTPDINVNYAPHLHFQIIKAIGNYNGDYPGVCHSKDLDFYKDNCPDPNLLLQLY